MIVYKTPFDTELLLLFSKRSNVSMATMVVVLFIGVTSLMVIDSGTMETCVWNHQKLMPFSKAVRSFKRILLLFEMEIDVADEMKQILFDFHRKNIQLSCCSSLYFFINSYLILQIHMEKRKSLLSFLDYSKLFFHQLFLRFSCPYEASHDSWQFI